MVRETPAGGGIVIGLAVTALVWVLAMGACSTPPEVRPFPYFPDYVEKYADSTEVDDNCYTPGGKLDDGTRQQWNTNFCGCVDHVSRTVWIARRIDCDLDNVRAHEACHIAGAHLEGQAKMDHRKMCHVQFPLRGF